MPKRWRTVGLVGALTLALAAITAAPMEAQFLKKLKRTAEQKAAESVTDRAAKAAGVESSNASGGYTRLEITDETIGDLITAVTPLATAAAAQPSRARAERERQAKADSYNACKAKVMLDPTNLKAVDDATMDKYSAETQRLTDAMIKAGEAGKTERQLAYADTLQRANEVMQLKQYPSLAQCGVPPTAPHRQSGAGEAQDGDELNADIPSEIKKEYSRYALGQLRERVAMWVVSDGKVQGAPGGGEAPYTEAELAVLVKHKEPLVALKPYLTDDRVDWRSWHDLPRW